MPCHHLDWNGERWLLIGRPERILQYLRKGAVTLRPLGVAAGIWFNVQLIAVAKLRPRSRLVRATLRAINLPWSIVNRSTSRLAATVHERSFATAALAASLDLDYANLQDSFLPSYYPSRYLLYRPAVRRYYVWDRLSQGIFNR